MHETRSKGRGPGFELGEAARGGLGRDRNTGKASAHAAQYAACRGDALRTLAPCWSKPRRAGTSARNRQ